MLLPIANKGISQVMDIVTKTNGELGTIGGRIRGLGDEYTALGDQKFAPKDGPRFIGPEDSDGKDPNDDDAAQKQLAADTVSRALNGNAADAAKVNEVLTSISDDQLAGKAALSPNSSDTRSDGISDPRSLTSAAVGHPDETWRSEGDSRQFVAVAERPGRQGSDVTNDDRPLPRGRQPARRR